MLQDEITELLPDDERAALVSKLTQTLGSFTAQHLKDGKPWPFGELSGDGGQPAQALCQVHCHQKSALGYGPELSVMEKLGVNTTVIGGGCCGPAGNWGFEPGHYDISQTLGERELFPAIRNAADDTIVLADGFSCRTQIAQGTSADGVHLAQIMLQALDSADE